MYGVCLKTGYQKIQHVSHPKSTVHLFLGNSQISGETKCSHICCQTPVLMVTPLHHSCLAQKTPPFWKVLNLLEQPYIAVSPISGKIQVGHIVVYPRIFHYAACYPRVPIQRFILYACCLHCQSWISCQKRLAGLCTTKDLAKYYTRAAFLAKY